MTISTRNLLLAILFSAALVGCGGSGGGGNVSDSGGDDGGGGTSNPPPEVPDVEIAGLAGDWFGTFDRSGGVAVSTLQLTVADSAISNVILDGTNTNLTGSVTKDSENDRLFRFTLQNGNGQTISRGAWFVDPSGTYMLYLNDGFQTGVLQKGATTLPAYAKADVEQSWSGDTASTESTDPTAGFGAFTQSRASGACTAATATTSECNVTIGAGTTRAISQLTLDDPRGRWLGSYTDTTEGGGANGTTRVYLSPDKLFAGSWACVNFTRGPGGFPETCDFSSWTRQ